MIKPFVKLCLDEAKEVAEKHGFKIRNVTAKKHTNGFISVYVTWDTGFEGHRFKYVTEGGYLYDDSCKSIELIFNDAPTFFCKSGRFDAQFEIEVGLKSLNDKGEEEGELDYSPVFFRNLKYAVEVWFAPEDWEDYGNAVDI